ncbi:MAG: VCBS repeat-containing protein [Verrucomicrobiales bacterium]|nr:VCBS repeat-containing protein [Verrucomicrobiales bacterium]
MASSFVTGLSVLSIFCAELPARSAAQWREEAGSRFAVVEPVGSGRPGFTALAASETGIRFTNHLAETAAASNRIYENGSGVALGDVDGDGWCDIYFCRLEGGNALYRNLGHGRFEDWTERAGVECANQHSTGAALADIDGDRDLDLLVTSIGGGARLFVNDGTAKFAEATESGLLRKFGSTTMALGDIDGDGDLDVYVANYRTTTYKDAPPGVKAEVFLENGRIVVQPEERFTALTNRLTGGLMLIEKGEPDVLYVNKGNGRFGPISWTGGAFVDEEEKKLARPPLDWGLSAMFRDLNGDRTPDLYICNDFFFSTDKIWLNEAGRRFRAIPRLALRIQSRSSMAVDFADINRDGLDDFVVVDMLSRDHTSRHRQRANFFKGVDLGLSNPESRPEVMRNTLFLNRGDGTYAEIAQLSGVAASEWSWSAIFLDVDLDGWEDLLVSNGNDHDSLDADAMKQIVPSSKNPSAREHYENLLKFPRLPTANLAFRNRGDLTFAEASADWGFDTVGISHGMALGDLDNDGDLDVVVNNLHAAAGVYRNNSTAARVAVRLKGEGANTRGVGAKIQLWNGAVPRQSQEMISGGRYLSCDDTLRVFAAGALTNRMRIVVTWRSGKQSVVEGVQANGIYEIEEAKAGGKEVQSSKFKVQGGQASEVKSQGAGVSGQGAGADNLQPLFEDVSHLLAHRHSDLPFNDFERQPLLSHELSQLGPGVAWFDLDSDGWDDLIVGSGRGGHLAAFRNSGQGRFSRISAPFLVTSTLRDHTGVVALAPASGKSVLLVGSSNYEDGPNAASVVRYDFGQKVADDLCPGHGSSTGPLAVADIDADGDLDLFVGGRVNPGRYPEAASSRLFRNEGGNWVVDSKNARLLEQIGLVSGAVFSDLNGDGLPELVLACEWGPVRVLENRAGKFADITEQIGLGPYTGWWNSVASGDFDGDGSLDIVAGNWGRNTKYQHSLQHPLKCYFGNFNGDGVIELVETYFDRTLNKTVPWRDLDTMAGVFPPLRGQFPTYRSYGEASVESILGDHLQAAQVLQATTLDSMIFLNRAGKFEVKSLPVEAQLAPAFGIAVGDADGDGNEDIFLAQNFFDVEPETSRYDAGLGLWLRGQGNGNFTALSASESGVRIFGQQRGCALSDYDHDGRLDLCVTQNRSATTLFRNATARPGLRVRLKGPPGNPSGIGAVLRLEFSTRIGPAREIHAGSGYWSQDSATQILAIPERLGRLWVRWPGGREEKFELPREANSFEVEVDIGGAIRSVQ